ncbi:MAG: 2-C-methyl-D-erythritol 2,4-cyclodiphosphate synthase, partial [Helicobacter sp.]|nr:2-C-methyl-D-erythritol 2,4-cyclodiphosphate synthase [Helicobacter sp.]
TIFVQKPKISPYKQAIEKNIAKLLEIPLFCVNVKATTTEKLGFIGREEGILVHSSVVLTYFQWHTII